MCKDKIVLKLEFFAKGYGAGEDPRRACILAYFIGVCFILMGKDNCFNSFYHRSIMTLIPSASKTNQV